MPHYLETIAEQVNATHPGLGELAAFTLLAVKARRCMMIIAPSGCGKSKITEWIERQIPGALFWRTGTAAGLTDYMDVLNNFRSVVVIDDLAAMGTPYRRENTMMIFADLVYSHRTRIDTGQQHFYVEDFQGACIIGAQPVVLKDLVKLGGWDGHLHDKTIRYYHLKRPITVNLDDIGIDVDWGLDIEKVEALGTTDELFLRIARWLRSQWSLARAMEHTQALLKAAAALDNREQVTREDVQVVAGFCKPLTLEEHILYRSDFEAPRTLRNDLYYLILEFASRGTFQLTDLIDTYKVSETSARRIMEVHNRVWKIVKKTPTTYAPSEWMDELLKRVTPIGGNENGYGPELSGDSAPSVKSSQRRASTK